MFSFKLVLKINPQELVVYHKCLNSLLPLLCIELAELARTQFGEYYHVFPRHCLQQQSVPPGALSCVEELLLSRKWFQQCSHPEWLCLLSGVFSLVDRTVTGQHY